MPGSASGKEVVDELPHPDSDGLQYIPRPGRDDKYLVGHRTSLDDPEVVSSQHHKLLPVQSVEETSYQQQPAFHQSQQNANGQKNEAVESSSRRRRCCGLSMRLFIILVILGVLIVVGAVLGGVLGTVLKHKNNDTTSASTVGTNTSTTPSSTTTSTTPSSTSNDTASPLSSPLKLSGYATLNSSDTMLLYYQLSNGSIVEASFPAAEFNDTTTNLTNHNWTLVTNDADMRSPLAVTTWRYPLNNAKIDQLYFTKNGYVSFVGRSSASKTWSASQAITSDAIAANSPALCVCAEPTYMKGVRVYFGSAQGGIQELKYNITTNNWTSVLTIDQSDAKSGVGCTTQVGTNRSWVNVYFRNTTSATIQQWAWGYGAADVLGLWIMGTTNSSQVTEGSNIAVEYDNLGTDYVFFQSDTGIQRGTIVPHTYGSDWGGFTTLSEAPYSPSVHSWYVDGIGPTAVIPTSSGELEVIGYSYNGGLSYNKTVIP